MGSSIQYVKFERRAGICCNIAALLLHLVAVKKALRHNTKQLVFDMGLALQCSSFSVRLPVVCRASRMCCSSLCGSQGQ